MQIVTLKTGGYLIAFSHNFLVQISDYIQVIQYTLGDDLDRKYVTA